MGEKQFNRIYQHVKWGHEVDQTVEIGNHEYKQFKCDDLVSMLQNK
jgi:hypothetical protein